MEIVVVGCNGFGKVHLRSIKGADISIVERKDAVADEVMNRYRIKHRYKSYDEAIRSGADIIDLAVPHDVHRDLAIEAMGEGKNVIVEKPIATTIEDANLMISASKRHGVKFMVAEQYFFDPSVRKARDLIDKGTLGKIGTIIVRDQRHFENPGWRNKTEIMGGGALIDGGIHYVDTILNLGGDYTKLISSDTHIGSTLNGEDNAVAMMQFSNGATGLLYYSWAYRNPPPLPGIEIVGSEGSLYEDVSTRSHLDFKEAERKTAFGDLVLNGRSVGVQTYDVFETEFSEFIDAVKNDTPVPFDPELAKRDLALVLEVYKQNSVPL